MRRHEVTEKDPPDLDLVGVVGLVGVHIYFFRQCEWLYENVAVRFGLCKVGHRELKGEMLTE